MPSTSIARTEYDPARQVLSVWFVASGKRYDYQDVPLEVVESFRRAFSKGRFFNENIRDRYRYRQVSNDRPPAQRQASGTSSPLRGS